MMKAVRGRSCAESRSECPGRRPVNGMSCRTVNRAAHRRGGRKVVTLALAVTVMIFTMMCLSGFTSEGRRAEEPVSVSPVRYYEVIRVRANDTLWDIASRCSGDAADCSAADVRNTVQEIMQVNAMKSSRIYVGQQIAVPCQTVDAA